jgi:hypothetical protein
VLAGAVVAAAPVLDDDVAVVGVDCAAAAVEVLADVTGLATIPARSLVDALALRLAKSAVSPPAPAQLTTRAPIRALRAG